MSSALRLQLLPAAAPRTVLAFGAFLKNSACLLRGREALFSEIHGDLSTPEACIALAGSVEALVAHAGGSIEAVSHDLHPDFESTRLAVTWAEKLGVPALAVQHHHAHIGVVQAEQGSTAKVVGLALDGVGLGNDGSVWGGELLLVEGARYQRLDALSPLCLPGADAAAREPWRMAAALLHVLGRTHEIPERLGESVGYTHARALQTLLERNLNCPKTTSAGRWFDAAAGLLSVCVRQSFEAEAAIKLETLARTFLEQNPDPSWEASGLDLVPLGARLLSLRDEKGASAQAEGAALFHVGLARALEQAAVRAAREHDTREVVLGGGCFMNRVLTSRLQEGLRAHGLEISLPMTVSCGDAGLSLGQAWITAHSVAHAESTAGRAGPTATQPGATPCA